MWELNRKKSWAPKNWCFWNVVLEKTLESLLDSKEIKSVNPEGNKSWIFIGRLMLKLKLQYFGHLMWHLVKKVGEGRGKVGRTVVPTFQTLNYQHHLCQNHLEHLWRPGLLGVYSIILIQWWIVFLSNIIYIRYWLSFTSQKTQIMFLTSWSLLPSHIKQLYHMYLVQSRAGVLAS